MLASDISTSLLISENKAREVIGDIRAGADLGYAEKLISAGITSRDDIMPWGSEIEAVTKEIRRLEKGKEAFLEPIAKAKRAVEAARKEMSGWFDDPITVLQNIKDRLSGPYGRFIFKCKQEDEAKAKAEQEAAAAKAKAEASSDFMAEVAVQEVLSEPVKVDKIKVQTMTGSTSVRFLDRVRVLDIQKVPREYLMFDEGKALIDFKSGRVKEIPGLEFYQEAKTWVR